MSTIRFTRSRAAVVPRFAVLLGALVAACTVLVSSASAAIAPSNTAFPALSGTPAVGSTLTASPGTWSGDAPITFGYQWQRCDSPATVCANIAGSTSSAYVLAGLDGGGTVRVAVVGTNAAGSQIAYSAVTSAIANAAGAPASTVLPAISGTLQSGSTLTAATGTWAGTPPLTFNSRWLRCNPAGTSCAAITGATAQTYQLVPADVGSTIAVDVQAVNAGGNASARSPVTAAVAAATSSPASTALPSIGGSAVEGMTLTGSVGTWTGTLPITFANAWRRCDVAGAACQTIAGAAGLSYVLAHGDVGQTIRFEVGATNAAGSITATSLQTAVVTIAPSTVGQPTAKQQCKHGGWQTFTGPSFRNQGQCVRFVATRSEGNGHRGHSGDDNHRGSSVGNDKGHSKDHSKDHSKKHGRNGGGD